MDDAAADVRKRLFIPRFPLLPDAHKLRARVLDGQARPVSIYLYTAIFRIYTRAAFIYVAAMRVAACYSEKSMHLYLI